MPLCPLLFLPLAAILCTPVPTAAFEAGTRWIDITPAHRSEPVRVLMTYPAQADGEAFRLGADAMWTGVPARRNATPVAQRFPLVILSHGSGGNAAGLGWLSTELAENGFIVAAPNHPHTTSGDSIQTETVKFWERPQDISSLIDTLLADPQWSKAIDPQRIGAIGFSLGGASVMLTAGAHASLDAFRTYCADTENPQPDCAWYRRGGVDFGAIDRGKMEGDYRDQRISAMVVVDPALVQAYQPDSLADISIPALALNLGEGDGIPRAVRADAVAKAMHAAYATIPGAIHFSFLGLCNPQGPALLKSYGEDDPVCDDGGDIPRAVLHRQMFLKIAVFLRKTLVER